MECKDNEKIIYLMIESIEAENIWAASHKMKHIIMKLSNLPEERNRLEGYALRLLAYKFEKKEK